MILGRHRVSGGMKQDLNSMPRNYILVDWIKTRNPSYQTSKGWRVEAIFPWFLTPVKNTFLIGAKAVNTGTNFIIGDIG